MEAQRPRKAWLLQAGISAGMRQAIFLLITRRSSLFLSLRHFIASYILGQTTYSLFANLNNRSWSFASRFVINIHALSMAEPSLKELWEEAEVRFKLTTGKALRLSPAKTLEDVRREFEVQQIGDAGKEAGKGRAAKDFGLVALQCLKLLGGVAAQGAAIVSLISARSDGQESR